MIDSRCVCSISIGLLVLVYLVQPLAAHDGHNHDHRHEKAVKVADQITYRPTAVPDRIILTWSSDPARSQAVTWRTDTSVNHGHAELAVAEAGPGFEKKAKEFDAIKTRLNTDLGPAYYHTVNFEGLQPATKYVYRVGDGVNWSEWSHFQTASTEPQPFTFVYFGDAQNRLKSMWSRVIREAYSDAPKARFFLHAGDLVNSANSDAEWGEWFYAGGWIHRTLPCIATPGNHEYDSLDEESSKEFLSRHWRPQFALPENGPKEVPETAYYIDYQGVRIVSLNSNEKFIQQRSWLENILNDNPNRWTIITHHHPLYAVKPNRDNGLLRRVWQPIYDKYGVDLVLQGHDHSYARSQLMTAKNLGTGVNIQPTEGGAVYVVSVSGPKMYDIERRPFFRRAAEDTQLYQIISIDGDQLKFEARTAIGELYDAFTLEKQPGKGNRLIDRIPAAKENRRPVAAPRE